MSEPDPEMQEQFEMLIETLTAATKNSAPALAETGYALFEAYQDAGFSEEQAMELLKNDPISGDFGDV